MTLLTWQVAQAPILTIATSLLLGLEETKKVTEGGQQKKLSTTPVFPFLLAGCFRIRALCFCLCFFRVFWKLNWNRDPPFTVLLMGSSNRLFSRQRTLHEIIGGGLGMSRSSHFWVCFIVLLHGSSFDFYPITLFQSSFDCGIELRSIDEPFYSVFHC